MCSRGGGCQSIYFSGFTYKRHLQAAHRELENQDQDDMLEADIDNGVAQAVHSDSSEESPNATDDERDDPDTEHIIEDIQHSTAQYVLHLKSSNVPASTFQDCLNTSRDYIVNIVDKVQKAAAPILQDVATGTHPCEEKVQHFNSILQAVTDPIGCSGLATQYQQRQFCIQTGALVLPEEKELGLVYKESLNRSTGRTQQKQIRETFQYVPLKENLKLFLEQPGYMHSILQEEQKRHEDNILHSYWDGSYYKERDDEGMVIDVLLYSDDFETSNPLGSKKGRHKVLGVYMTVLSLPTEYQAKLENILLVALAKSVFVTNICYSTTCCKGSAASVY